MTSREESDRTVLRRAFSTLSGIIATLSGIVVFALASGYVVADLGFVPSAYAQDSDSEESEAEDGDSEQGSSEEKNTDTDQDDAKAETDVPAESEKESQEKSDSPPPKKKKQQDEPVSEAEQEQAEKAAGDNVDEAEEAADKEEDAKAAAEEAAGAEVELDESDDDEEEPEESAESPDKPPVVPDGKQPDKETTEVQKRVIGATATIMEKQSELLFRARVDSGAKSCSLHIEDYKIEGEAETMSDNIGKVITFHITNGNEEPHWLKAKIAGYVIVKNASHRERRYKVPLTLRYKDFEKTVLVTLNNREKMDFPLLLGRNFLIKDFVVDVELENNELHTR